MDLSVLEITNLLFPRIVYILVVVPDFFPFLLVTVTRARLQR